MKGKLRKGGEGAKTRSLPKSLTRVLGSLERVWLLPYFRPRGTPREPSAMLAWPAGKTPGRLPPNPRPPCHWGPHTAPPGTCSLGCMSASLFCCPVRGLENLPLTFSSDAPPGDFSRSTSAPHCTALPDPLPFYPICCSKRSSRAFTSYLRDYELFRGRNYNGPSLGFCPQHRVH